MAASHQDALAGTLTARAFRPPRPGGKRLVDLVTRTRLVTRCVDAIDASVLLLHAPAGYGKTTLLSQWEIADPRPFAWIALDERDNDPTQLVRSITAALQEVEPVSAAVIAPLSVTGPKLSPVAVPRLCDALRGRERPFVLVLDDLHLLRNPESLRAISAIAESVPPDRRWRSRRGSPQSRWGLSGLAGCCSSWGPRIWR